MSYNRHLRCSEETHFSACALLVAPLVEENPIAAKVLGPYPVRIFLPVATLSPSPERLEYRVVYFLEHLLADHVAVIVCPTAYHRVELGYQLSGRPLLIRSSPHFRQEFLNALLRGSDERV